MEPIVAEIVEVISRTPATLRAFLGGMPEALLSHRIAADTFSPADVVRHLIFGEKTDWVPRVRHILERGDAEPFAPFDRRGGDALRGKPIAELLDEFEALRRENVGVLRSLSPTKAQLALPGRHPELGSVTLRQLLVAWAVHDLNHVDQIARVLSNRFAPGVGPWKQYLGILNR